MDVPAGIPLAKLEMLAFERTLSPCIIVNSTQGVVAANNAALKLYQIQGFKPGVLLLKFLSKVMNSPGILAAIHRGLVGEATSTNTTLFISDKEFIGNLRVVPVIRRNNPQEIWAIVFFDDKTTYVRLQRRLTQDEFFDRSTGLLNRKTLDIMLDLEIEKAQRNPKEAMLAIMLVNVVNLENLKAVYNSTIINHILEHLGNCIKTALRSNDLLFRYDENRILAVITNFSLKTDLLIVAERVEDQVAIPFHTSDATIHLQAVIGITVFPEDGESCDTLIGNASSALAHAAEEGKPWLMFNQGIHERAMDRLYLRSALSQAVKRNELELRYMNLVDRHGKTKGLEALVRWRHPERGLMAPDAFLPVAVHSRIMGAITRWVLYKIIKDWEEHIKPHGLFISLNLSGQDFADPYFLESIQTAIGQRIPAANIKVEVTESECIRDLPAAITSMKALNKSGIDVFIDDFGVGQSSLTYLKDLPAQWAKIDRSFIERVASSQMEHEFLKHIIALSTVRGLRVLLEGVETAEQYRVLRTGGATLFQGHYFGEPMELEALLARLPQEDWNREAGVVDE